MKTAIILLLVIGIPAFSQQPSITTNVVTAHPAFRIVNGQLYNMELSTNFGTITGHCIAVLTNGIVVRVISTPKQQVSGEEATYRN